MCSTELKHLEAIRRLAATIPQTSYDETWIGTDNPSLAFLICLSMGPWKENRRFTVARDVVKAALSFGSTLHIDLSSVQPEALPYPLTWQRKIITNVIGALHEIDDLRFGQCVDRWFQILIDGSVDAWVSVALEFFAMCGVSKKGTKTLWLFLRDALGMPAFPVDRRVRRILRACGLPADSWTMTRLCEEAGVSTNDLARACFVYGESFHSAEGGIRV